MSLIMKPITVTAFNLMGSVGEKGTNNTDDVLIIQLLLNGIPQELGDAFPRLLEDGKSGGPNWERTVESIRIFQSMHFKFQDGLVEPNKRTHQALRVAMLNRDKRLSKFTFVEMLPNDGLDDTAKPNRWQMVPNGGSKKLRLVGSGGVELLSYHFNKEGIAKAERLTNDLMEVFGLSPGDTTLTVKQGTREVAKLDIGVKPFKTIPLQLHYVRDAATGDGTRFKNGSGATLVNGINGIYYPQINIHFTLKGEREIKKINGKDVKFDQFFFWEDGKPIPAELQQFTDADMTAESPGRPNTCHVFLVWEMQSTPNSIGDLNGLTLDDGPCVVEDETRLNRFHTIAHEIGHYFRIGHDTDKHSLMCEGKKASNNGNRIRKAAANIMNKV